MRELTGEKESKHARGKESNRQRQKNRERPTSARRRGREKKRERAREKESEKESEKERDYAVARSVHSSTQWHAVNASASLPIHIHHKRLFTSRETKYFLGWRLLSWS